MSTPIVPPASNLWRAAAALTVAALLISGAGRSQAQEAEPKTFRVALTGKYPPFSFYSNEGELAGFDVDVARAVAGHLDRELILVTTEWDGILAGLLAGKYDAIIGSMAITPEREKRVNFTLPYYVSGAQLFVHDDQAKGIESIADVYGKKIGVGLGETYEHYLRNEHPNVETVTYKSAVDIFQDMRNRRLDGFVTDRLVGLYQIKASNEPFTPAGPLLYQERIGIPVIQDNPDLLRAINHALIEMKADGEFKRLQEKWFGAKSQAGSESAMPTRVVVRKLARGFGITLLVACVSLVAGFVFAIPWGVALNNRSMVVHSALRAVNDFVRGTPLLIQLFFVYFGAPQIGITLSPIQSACLTLTLNSAAYMAEAIRSGLLSVGFGQRLAGQALGLSKPQVFRYVVWPQAFRVAIPSLMNIVVAFIKDTALISVISVAEVVREAQSIISVTYNPIQYYFIVAAMFFAFTFPLMKIAGRVERSIKQRGFVHD